MGDRVEGGTGPQTADTAIMASINCVTFNHADYIRTALDSFLMQKTDFAFEILVHDDASTDGTSSIIREYAARYPDQVKPLIQTENQYSQGIDNISGAFNFPRARESTFLCVTGTTISCHRISFRSRWITWKPTLTVPCASTVPK